MVDLSGVPAPQPVLSEATHKSKHRHKDKKHKHRHREHVPADKRPRSGDQPAVGVAKGSIALAADYNSDPESGELSDTTRLAQKEAEREHQSRLRAAEAPALQAVQAASAPASGGPLPEVPSLKRPRDADASLAEGQDPKRSKPAIDGIQGSLSNPSSMQASPEAHAIANGSAALQADNGLPQSVAHLPEADGGSEHRSHRKHRHKHHRKDREASAKPLGVTHRQEKRHSSSSHKEGKDRDRSRRHCSKQADDAEPSAAEAPAAPVAPDVPSHRSPEPAEALKPSLPVLDAQDTGSSEVPAAVPCPPETAAVPGDAKPGRSPHRASSRDPGRSHRHRAESREPSHSHRQHAESRGHSHADRGDGRRRDAIADDRAARDRSRDSHRAPRGNHHRDDRGGNHRGSSRGLGGDRDRRHDRRENFDRGMQCMGRDGRFGRDQGRDRDQRGRPDSRSDVPSRRRESSRSRERRRKQEEEDAARLEESMKEMMEGEMDEDQLIEQRRKERQAIMAKHQQAVSVAAPTATAGAAAGATPPATTPPTSPSPRPSSMPSPLWSASPHKPGISAEDSHQQGEGDDWEVVTRQLDERADSPLVPSSEDGDAAATELDIWQKAHQADGEAEAESKAQEGDDEVGAGKGREEAEAAQRYQQEHQKEDAAAELDMFAEDVVATPPVGPVGTGPTPVVKGLTDNYDDPEGYYLFQVGEMMDGRYEVFASHGKGVFSTVLRARDKSKRLDDGNFQEVAIKMIRANDTMFAAGQTEKRILNKLGGLDPTSKFHCIRLLRTFEYRSHLCLVFESLDINLRELTKKYGAGVGLNLDGVCVYAKQMLVALHHLKNCGVLHADIKPDNILVNKKRNIVKLCDFGSAMLSGDNELTPYLVSRFYRAPEVILGLKYDHPMDIWSVGCVIYELFTSKILFPGKSNNEMLRCFMDLKGPFPKKMVKRGAFHEKHFESDPNMSFSLEEEDPIDHRRTRRIIANPTKKRDFAALLSGAEGDKRRVALLADLLERMMHLDPDKRMTPKEALRHPFIKGMQAKK